MRSFFPHFALLAAWLAGCETLPTATVSQCYPNDGDCGAFVGANARVDISLPLGRDVFEKRCRTCHGPDGRGADHPDRGDFTDPGWHRRWSDGELQGIVTAGRGTEMPGFRMSARELKSVVAYVRRFDPDRGRTDAVIEKKEGQGPSESY